MTAYLIVKLYEDDPEMMQALERMFGKEQEAHFTGLNDEGLQEILDFNLTVMGEHILPEIDDDLTRDLLASWMANFDGDGPKTCERFREQVLEVYGK